MKRKRNSVQPLRRRFMAMWCAVGVILCAGLAFAGVALAAQWNDVDGSCNNDGSWKIESKIRHITTSEVDVKFSATDLPSGGLRIRLVRADSHDEFGYARSYYSLNDSQFLAFNVNYGVEFHNKFKKLGSGSNNSWSGNEYY